MKESGVIYLRVSTEQQATKGISLDMQLARCAEYIEARGLALLDTIVDAGVSAKSIAGRHGFTRILDMVRRREISHVVAYKLDRAFRNTEEGLHMISLMAKKSVGLHIVSEQGTVRTESADDEFMLTLKLGLAQRERKVVSERTKAALSRKREKGEFCGGEPPFGYRAVGGWLVPDAEEQRISKKVHHLHRQRYSLRRIVKCLAQDGCVNRRGRLLTKTAVERILKSA